MKKLIQFALGLLVTVSIPFFMVQSQFISDWLLDNNSTQLNVRVDTVTDICLADGVTCISPSTALSNPMTTVGDLILGGTSGAAGRLAIGTSGQLITSNGTTASWATYAGTTDIVTVGTIGTGTWEGTAIGDTYISSATTWNAKLSDVVDDTTPTLGGDLDVADKNLTGAGRISFTQELDNGSKTTDASIDFATDQKQKVTLTANTITLTLDTTSVGVGNYLLKIVNGGLATLTWASESGSVYFPGGTDPALTASGTDIVTFYFDGVNWYGVGTLDFQ